METLHATTLSTYTSFFKILETFHPLSEGLKEELLDSTCIEKYPKGYKLFSCNEIISDAYYIQKGIARTFYCNNIREITTNITSENKIFTSPSSFFTGQPSFEEGELMEDSVLIKMSRNTIEHLCLKYLELNFIMRRLGELFYVALDQRVYSLHMKTAQERYDNLMITFPGYFQRISLGIISSYLGMTQETLSRLRSKVGQNKIRF